ncbi:MAG: extracellular solute-binding protein [Clostridia bacterium]|nr:extracellular solute-binding protein [Clostridia bacterium]
MNKKFTLLFALVLVVVMSLSIFLVACNPTDDNPGTDDTDLTGTYDVKVWVSEIEGVTTLTEAQIDAFEEANPGITINATVEGMSEGDAATQVLTDVETAPDVYCFAQDQLARLVQAGALARLGEGAAAEVAANNDGGSVAAGQVAGVQYAYPLTSDNGYFLYYDKSVVSDEQAKTLEGIIAACEAANKFFRFELEGSAWYTASFFFATGCVSNWTADEMGRFTALNDTWNSPEGLVALKGMQKLLKSTCYESNSANFDGAGAIVTGTWNSGVAASTYGDNLGAAKLPTFTVDGETYQLGSFTGNKLMGVKPQTDVKKQAVLSKLALWLSGEECQAERFEDFGWGPSNKNVQASEAVQADPSLVAFAAQAEFGTPQGQISGAWWDIAKVVATAAKEATDDAGLQAALDTYYDAVSALVSVYTPEWGVVGAYNGWSADGEVMMTEQPDGSFKSNSAITFEAGSEFKCRDTRDWSGLDVGGNGPGGNYVVETAGTYYVVLTFKGSTGTITLIPA